MSLDILEEGGGDGLPDSKDGEELFSALAYTFANKNVGVRPKSKHFEEL